jgi:salicylate hydroxylase
VVDDGENGIELNFTDGSRKTADAVIGCGGIRLRVQHLILGECNPPSYLQYSKVYTYRGLLIIDKVIEAVGQQTASGRPVTLLYMRLEKCE